MQKDDFKCTLSKVHDLFFNMYMADEFMYLHSRKVVKAPELENTPLEPENHAELSNFFLHILVQSFYSRTNPNPELQSPPPDLMLKLTNLFATTYQKLIKLFNDRPYEMPNPENFIYANSELWEGECETVTHKVFQLYNSYEKSEANNNQ